MKIGAPASKKLIHTCPFCGGELCISRLSCSGCSTQIESVLRIPPFFRLPEDLQEFVLTFLRCEGKIRDVEQELGISYPTVCKRLDQVNQLLGNKSNGSYGSLSRRQILEQLERGAITVKEASELLKSTKL